MAYESIPHDEMITVHPTDDGVYEGRVGSIKIIAQTAEEALAEILKRTHRDHPPIPTETHNDYE